MYVRHFLDFFFTIYTFCWNASVENGSHIFKCECPFWQKSKIHFALFRFALLSNVLLPEVNVEVNGIIKSCKIAKVWTVIFDKTNDMESSMFTMQFTYTVLRLPNKLFKQSKSQWCLSKMNGINMKSGFT